MDIDSPRLAGTGEILNVTAQHESVVVPTVQPAAKR